MSYAKSISGVVAVAASIGCIAVPACLAESEASFQADSMAQSSNQRNATRESSNQASGEWGSKAETNHDSTAQYQSKGIARSNKQEDLPTPWGQIKNTIPYLWGANNIPGKNTQWGNTSTQPIIPQTTPAPIASVPSVTTSVKHMPQISTYGARKMHTRVQTQVATKRVHLM
ncbi:MAG TPA: hypothetical protein V6C81_12520 [Planktothrix sp.]|jgi:hypothetical protein